MRIVIDDIKKQRKLTKSRSGSLERLVKLVSTQHDKSRNKETPQISNIRNEESEMIIAPLQSLQGNVFNSIISINSKI